MTHYINCRAHLEKDCLNGLATSEQFFGDDLPMDEDGTWEPSGGSGEGTIVCDPCYVKLMRYTPSGRGLNHELEGAIASYRKRYAAPSGVKP